MKKAKGSLSDYRKIERAIDYLERNQINSPNLSDVARFMGLSDFHFQRLFQKWAGVSPKKFLQYLAVERARELLEQNQDLLSSSYGSGLSSPGRLHDLFVKIEAMSPGEYKLRGKGLEIRYGFHETPFGLGLVGLTGRGVCHLSFINEKDRKRALSELRNRWCNAKFVLALTDTKEIIQAVFDQKTSPKKEITVLAAGSPFRLKVWEALLKIPKGAIISYQDLAKLVGSPNASRAVGSALAENAVALLIPCHRVIQAKGIVGQYRWGSARKRIMIGFEQVRCP